MKRLVFWLVLCVTFTTAWAQEICNNGKDDDNDGFIDCYDNACAGSTFCKDFFLGEAAKCEVTPPAFPQFTMSLDFSSPNGTTNHLSRMAIGDLNRDGMPEIITMNKYSKRLFILNGNDGSIQQQATVTWEPQWEIAIANIDNDNCGEIFFYGIEDPPGDNNATYHFYAYDCNLNLIWQSNPLRGEPINYGLADFDGDGKVELYAKDAIYDAHTGTRIVKSSATSWSKTNGGPVAIDMVGNDTLELVIGCAIYEVNLGDRTADNGSLTLLKSRSDYFTRHEYNATSIADYNLDGHLDVLASGSTIANGENTTVFFWDVFNDNVLTYSDPIPGDFTIEACPTATGEYYKNGWKGGTGRLNIADLDGDGKLNVSYVSGKFLYALDENLQPLSWSPKDVNEETSGYTGCTLFDFNGDGKSEIVYRDERYLYIINGTNGTTYNQQTCISRTNREYPIVADVDADGSTELCVTCGFDDVDAANNFCATEYSEFSHVRVFKSASDPWVPARRVWNQHGYFNVNVNENLTIPIRQQKHHLVFSTGSCTQGPNRPLNGFLNQSPFLNIDGCPTYKSPDLAFVQNSLTVTAPTCPTKNFDISFQFINQGDIALSGNVPITFYNGNPLAANAIKLNTITAAVSLGVNGIHTITNATVLGPGNNFTLYIVLNDNGTTVPTPIALPNTAFLECDYADNVISAPVAPLPGAIEALKIQNNIKCVGSSSPNNGAMEAYVPTSGGGKNTSDYNFYWAIGNIDKSPPADLQGAIQNGRAEGTYKVFAVHKTVGCRTASDTVIILRNDRKVEVLVKLLHAYDHCTIANGSLQAVTNDAFDGKIDSVGELSKKFTYEWFQGNQYGVGALTGTDSVATGLPAGPYTVGVTDKATGCRGINSLVVPNATVKPPVTTSATGITCSVASSGTVSANVGGVTSGYSFAWSSGSIPKPVPDHTTASVSGLAGGTYVVLVTNTATQCVSDPKTETVAQSAPVTVAVTGISPQTSCDTNRSNGTASAHVSNSTTGYHFEWFTGQNTLPANRFTPTSTSTPSVTGLKTGIYTVKATNTATGCSDTEEVTINNAVVPSTLQFDTKQNLTTCTTPNGSITVNTLPDPPANYKFFWYKGDLVKPTTDFTPADTFNTLQGLVIGRYTVRAVHRTKFCATNSVTEEIFDNTPTIDIDQDLTTIQFPSSCNANNGTMEINVTAPGNTLGFLIEWHRNGNATRFAFVDNVAFTRQDTLSSATFTIVATNRNNGCTASEDFPLPFNAGQTLELIDTTHITKCFPTYPADGGVIQVKLTPTPLPPFTVDDYLLKIYAGKMPFGTPMVPPIDGATGTPNGDGTSNYDFSGLTPGFYSVVAVEDNLALGNCSSAPVIIEIKEKLKYPVITTTLTNANMNCAGATGTGAITVRVDNGAPVANYTYAWHVGQNVTDPALGAPNGTTAGSGEQAINLVGNSYTVQVTNIATTCRNVLTTSIINAPPVISLTAANIGLTHIDICTPGMATGAANITGVSENGSPGTLANYTFSWLDAGQNVLPNLATPNTTPTINTLVAGNYFVTVTKTAGSPALNCEAAKVNFEIKDNTINTAKVELVSFIKPTRCLKPANITGELVAKGVSSNVAHTFTYRWDEGLIAGAGLPESSTANMSGITIPSPQTSITYIVEVTNQTTQCTATDTYVLPLEVVPVPITASAAPVTSCIADDGAVFATVTNISPADYNYNWNNGQVEFTPADFTGSLVTGRSVNFYTVHAVDQNDAFCRSAAVTVQVLNKQDWPVVTAAMVSPLTICDPTRPNGVARASVSGDFVNYTYNWYAGVPPLGAVIYTGAEVGNLSANTFSVIATHFISGCSDTTRVAINTNMATLPIPQVQVISNVTSCVTDNGELAASVNGITADYIFHWYTSDPGTPADTLSASYKGEAYHNLSTGHYYVSATSRATGCISGPAGEDIIDAPLFPEFEFKFEAASCDEANGYVSILPLNSAEIESVIWTGTGINNAVTGPTLTKIPAGDYSVTVTTILGCATTKDVTLKTEIHAYNGVSRNNDSKNDIFLISCIEDFPGNVVKIFNRAGTLVYEAAGYDNIATYFDGKSNKGISVMGDNLPDGTYFYVIDKRDGSKPVAGYLEVVN